MDATPTNSFDRPAARRRLLERLDAFRQRLRWHLAVAAALRVLLLACGFALASYALDRTFRLGLAVRLPLLLIALGVLLYQTWQRLVRPALATWDPITLADAVDRAAGRPADLAPRVATLLQDTADGSPALADAAARSADATLSGIDWQQRLDAHRLAYHELAISGVAVLIVALLAAFPQTSGLWLQRWFAGSNAPWPQNTYLSVVGLTDDRRLLVPRGEPATVFVRVKDGSVEPSQVTVVRRPPGSARVDATMTRFAPGDFRFDLPPVAAAETLELAGGDDEPDPITVQPVDRPAVEKLELVSQHPTEPTPTVHDFASGDTDLRFLPQTALTLRVRVNTPIRKLTCGERDVTIRQTADRTYDLTWTHRRPMRFQIELTAADTGLTSLATPLSVGLLTDTPPRVSLAYTGVRQRVTPQATIPLTIDARDDYGLACAGLAAKVEWLDAAQQRQTHATTRPVFSPPTATEKDVRLSETFTLADLHAPPGAIVSLAATASDARYEGPQTTRSKEATFRLVTPEELFKEILLRQQGERAKFRKLAEAATALRQDLTTLSPPMAPALARRHRDVLRETERIANALGESLTEMRLNALGTAESQALMQRNVTDPLKTLAAGPMAEQRDALDATITDVAAVVARQDRIVDAMNAVLKQMAQWDSFVDVINQLNEIIRLQEQAKRTTDGLKTKETNSAFDE